jgi:hypothetical protein
MCSFLSGASAKGLGFPGVDEILLLLLPLGFFVSSNSFIERASAHFVLERLPE